MPVPSTTARSGRIHYNVAELLLERFPGGVVTATLMETVGTVYRDGTASVVEYRPVKA
jgi:hypothetical protein